MNNADFKSEANPELQEAINNGIPIRKKAEIT